MEKEIEKLLTEGHITKLDKCTSDCFIAPIVIIIKEDDSIKLALDTKPINRQFFKNKYQMPNVDELIDGVSSKDTKAGGDLNLAIKRAKPNTADPSSTPGPETQEEIDER